MKPALNSVVLLHCLVPGAVMAATPMDYLRTHGPAADPVTRLSWGLIAISLTVVAVIALLVLWACLRRRPAIRADASGRLPVSHDTGGAAWIYVGVASATVVLFLSTIWTLRVLGAVAAPPAGDALTIEIVANQWWWEARYQGPGQEIITANEIHIPVGEPVRFMLHTDDVIHSFWVPKLAGKTDIVPGQTNLAWVQADEAGDYRGQCAEFCGTQHAHMAFHVVAEDPARFQAWRQRQLQPSVPPQSPLAIRGRDIFVAQCAKCHTVRGTSADGQRGPDLTHLMSRSRIAAGMLRNERGALSGWVVDAPSIKPGARMPAMKLDPDELHAVVDYLQTLQ